MNEHAGSASALSVLIVGVFAILLHQPDRPTNPRPTTSRSDPIKPAPRNSPPVSPPPATEKPVSAESTSNIRATPSSAGPPESLASHPTAEPSRIEPSPAITTNSPTSPANRSPRLLPKAPFTVVQAGERLADVAARIYGTQDASEALWRANRDQVARVDSPLTNGTLLRTP